MAPNSGERRLRTLRHSLGELVHLFLLFTIIAGIPALAFNPFVEQILRETSLSFVVILLSLLSATVCVYRGIPAKEMQSFLVSLFINFLVVSLLFAIFTGVLGGVRTSSVIADLLFVAVVFTSYTYSVVEFTGRREHLSSN